MYNAGLVSPVLASAAPRMALKRKHLVLEDKINILNEYINSKTSQRLLAEKYGIGKTQVCNILKDRATLFKEWQENKYSGSKRKFKSGNQDIDAFVYDWYCTAKDNDVPVTGRLLQEKALEVAKLLQKHKFKASNGWLHKFKVRHNIIPRPSGEANKASEEDSMEEPKVKVESGENVLLIEQYSGDHFGALNNNSVITGNETPESEVTEDNLSESDTSFHVKNNDESAVNHLHSECEDFAAHARHIFGSSDINSPERLCHNEHSTGEESRRKRHEGDDFPKTYIEAACLISKLERFANYIEHTPSLLLFRKIKEDYERQHWLQKRECHS